MDFRRLALLMSVVIVTSVVFVEPEVAWSGTPQGRTSSNRMVDAATKRALNNVPRGKTRELVNALDPQGTASGTSDSERIVDLLRTGKISLEELRAFVEKESKPLGAPQSELNVLQPPARSRRGVRPQAKDRDQHHYDVWVKNALNRIYGASQGHPAYLVPDGSFSAKTISVLGDLKWRYGLLPTGDVSARTEQLLAEKSGLPPPHRKYHDPQQQSSDADTAPFDQPAEAVYLDVTAQGAEVWVPKEGRRQVSSAMELREAIGQYRILIHAGLDLPARWSLLLPGDVTTIRRSRASRTETILEHVDAAKRLNSVLDLGTLRIVDSLPRPEETGDPKDKLLRMRQELKGMYMKHDEAEGWVKLHEEIDKVLAQEGAPKLERLSKEEIMEELRNGTTDMLFLIGHYSKVERRLYLRSGEWIGKEELELLPRRNRIGNHATEVSSRLIVLFYCDTGPKNGKETSPSEILLEKGAATIVLAPTGEITAIDIPTILRGLIKGKTVREVFEKLVPITQHDPAVGCGMKCLSDGICVDRAA